MATDFLYDENGDIAIKDGDLVIGDATFCHVEDLLLAERGFYKFSPLSGIGINRILLDEVDTDEVLKQVRSGLEADGFKPTKLLLTNDGKIEIDGSYES